jgi:hypothetical protein
MSKPSKKSEPSEVRAVDVIASGYEFICPSCNHYNTLIAWKQDLECEKCHDNFTANLPEHAID